MQAVPSDDAKPGAAIAVQSFGLRFGERLSGFNIYCGKAIWSHNEQGLENLARYIIRASLPARASQRQAGFSQARMTYIATDQSAGGVAKVICQSKDGNKR